MWEARSCPSLHHDNENASSCANPIHLTQAWWPWHSQSHEHRIAIPCQDSSFPWHPMAVIKSCSNYVAEQSDHAPLDGRWLLYFLTVQFQLMVVIENKEHMCHELQAIMAIATKRGSQKLQSQLLCKLHECYLVCRCSYSKPWNNPGRTWFGQRTAMCHLMANIRLLLMSYNLFILPSIILLRICLGTLARICNGSVVAHGLLLLTHTKRGFCPSTVYRRTLRRLSRKHDQFCLHPSLHLSPHRHGKMRFATRSPPNLTPLSFSPPHSHKLQCIR